MVTRPEDQAQELVDLLLILGAQPVEAPTIRIVPPKDGTPLEECCELANTFDWIVFTSVNGVDSFMRNLCHRSRDVKKLKGVRLCAVGPATAARLTKHGLQVDLVPQEHRAEAIVVEMRKCDTLSGRRILLPRADLAREVLPKELRSSGAEVVEVVAYRTVLAGFDNKKGPDIYRMLLEQQIDVVTFTSASTVRNFVEILGAEPAADLLNTTAVAAIGPVTSEAARKLNIRTSIMPTTYTVPALVDAIVSYFASRQTAIG